MGEGGEIIRGLSIVNKLRFKVYLTNKHWKEKELRKSNKNYITSFARF